MEENTVKADVGTSAEVVGVARRRVFSAEYKRRILEEVDRARPGEIGLILRREGLYSSQLGNWRKWRSGVSEKKRPGKGTEEQEKIKELEKENARLKLKLRKAEAMLDLQKKAAEILAYDEEKEGSDS